MNCENYSSNGLHWDYTWNVRDPMTLALMDENGSSNNAGSVADEAAVAAFIGLGKVEDSAMATRSDTGKVGLW